ncbi:MAG TPA: S-layer homology domain-containing protein [Chloroflexia bacterium]|nr:S-layer homology domain-containing protein [Chloroflexia bacterium]
MKYLVTLCGAALLFVGVLCCADNSRMTANAAAPVVTNQEASEKDAGGGTATATAAATATCLPNPNPNYVLGTGTGTIVPGTVDIGSHCDDCTTYLTLPFAYQLYDTTFTGVNISSNGNLQFDSNITGINDYLNACLPVTDRPYSYTIFAYWDDQVTSFSDKGIYTSISGTSPNRIFNIEFRTCTQNTLMDCSAMYQNYYEVRLYEGQRRFDVIYGPMGNHGASATIGVQRSTSKLTQYSCNTVGINNGLMLIFTQPYCATSTPTPTQTATATNTPSPSPTPTICSSNYVIATATAALVPGTFDIGSHCDDCNTHVTLPFPYQLYDTIFTGVNISSNGNLQFNSNITGINDYINACLPVTDRAYSYTIFAFWDDQFTSPAGKGIFTSITGVAPNRIFNIEFRTCLFSTATCGGDANYEVRLYEGQTRFDIVYGAMTQNGSTGTAGVQKDVSDPRYTQYSCNAPNLTYTRMLIFTLPPACPTSTPTVTQTSTPISTPSPTPTTCIPNYVVATATGTIVPGTVDIGNHCDDCTTHVTLPFPYQLYEATFTGVNISSNGNLQFNSNITGLDDWLNSCLPVTDRAYSYTIFPFWDDQSTAANAGGIFTSVSGTAPNRIFNIEWRTCAIGIGSGCPNHINWNYEVRLYEAKKRFDVVYGIMESTGSATIGVLADASRYTQYACFTPGIVYDGRMLVFTASAACSTATPSPTPVPPTITATRTSTSTPTITPTPTLMQPTSTATRTPTGTPIITPTSIPCGVGNYTVATATGTIVPGTADIGNHCEDCVTFINLPFPVQLYDRTFTGANISSNGVVELQGSFNDYLNRCLPSLIAPSTYAIFAYWDDQITLQNDNGIYTSITGTAPNLIFNIEFRTCQWLIDNCTYELYYEVRLYEAAGPGGQSHFDIVYGTMQGTGSSATIGVERDNTYYTQFSCNTQMSLTGLLLTFTLPPCATATPTPMQPANTATRVPTSTPTIAATSAASATTQAASPSPSPETTVIATSTSTSTTPIPCMIVFTDVPPTGTFYPYIRCLACRGILSGYPCGGEGEPCDSRGNPYFRPNNDITRGQIAKVVSNAAGFSEDPGPQVYEDVGATSTFYTWINRLSNRGHMGGYTCGTIPEEPCVPPDNRPYFRPFANATRGQLAKIVSNAAGVVGDPANHFYTDVPLDHPFYVWIMRLTNLGVMSGYLCGGEGEPCDEENRPYFRPFANVTRGQASKIVANTFYPNCETQDGR